VIGFHGLASDTACLRSRVLGGDLVLTIPQITQVVEYLLNAGCIATSPEQILRGLDPGKTHFLLSFDDGYFNNLLVLPLLERYKLPAQFALIGQAVTTGHAFWWDILSRTTPPGEKPQDALVDRFSMMPIAEVEAELVAKFGACVTRPAGDVDRPMSPLEARELAKHPLISMANHSQSHRVLTGLPEDVIEHELATAQETLQGHLGFAPKIVVYPYGQADEVVVRVARRMGFTLGFAGNHAKVALPFNTQSDLAMRIPRFTIFGDKAISPQCGNTQFSWKPSWTIKGIFGREHQFGVEVLES